jgi:hypothetical protein
MISARRHNKFVLRRNAFKKAADEGDLEFFRKVLEKDASVDDNQWEINPFHYTPFWLHLAKTGNGKVYSFLRENGVDYWSPDSSSARVLFECANTFKPSERSAARDFLSRQGYREE